MSDIAMVIALVGGLIAFDVVALRFGHDSRNLMRPESSRRSGPLHSALRDIEPFRWPSGDRSTR